MLRRLYSYFAPYRRHMALSLLFVVLFTIMSGVLIYLAGSLISQLFPAGADSAATFDPTTTTVGNGFLDSLKDQVSGFVHQYLITGNQIRDLRNLCIALLIVVILKNFFFFLQGFYAAYVEQGITKTLRDQVYNHLQTLSLQYFHRSRTGNLMSIAINDVSKIQETFNNTINNLIRDPLTILMFVGMMVVMSWQLTLVTLVVLPLIFLFIYQIGKLTRRASNRAQEEIADISSSLEETINNIRIVRAYAAESHESKKFLGRTGRYFRTMLKINRIRLLSSPVNEVLGVAAVVIILWWGGRQVLHHELLKPEDFVHYLLAMFAIIAPAKSVSNVHVKINEGLAAAKRIFDLLDTKASVVESSRPIQLQGFEKEIVFKDVFFKYEVGEVVLEDISFELKKGKIVALVGASGAGKSTIADLVCRFHDPTGGSIRIDGHDLKEVSFRSLRGLMGIVTQETLLFNDTVANNIGYPDSVNDRDLIIQAATAANAHAFISQMPKGYDTVIGNRGMMVSGGERQRLAIARALMRDPEILIFDEATSSLDTESERLVQEAIDHLMVGRTTLVIAHRLSTILHADMILVINDGRIVERGRHEELLRLNGVYRRLYDLQFERNNALKAGKRIAAPGETD